MTLGIVPYDNRTASVMKYYCGEGVPLKTLPTINNLSIPVNISGSTRDPGPITANFRALYMFGKNDKHYFFKLAQSYGTYFHHNFVV